jgi:hypothetical protein
LRTTASSRIFTRSASKNTTGYIGGHVMPRTQNSGQARRSGWA